MFKYDKISFLVILSFFPDLGIFANSSSVIFSDLIIFLTSGDKKPTFLDFVNEGISILIIDKISQELKDVSNYSFILERGKSVWSGKLSGISRDDSKLFLGV